MEKVLVIGDAIIDKHTRGTVSRISPEAPVPVVYTDSESEISLGAAANVAAQIAEAAIECYFAYKSYEDHTDSHAIMGKMCIDANVKPISLYAPHIVHSVTTKERVWAGDQQICRIDKENTSFPDWQTEMGWIEQIQALISEEEIDCVVFSDYNKGTLSDRFIQTIADFCFDRDIKTILDPKRYSYWGLQHLTIIKPNEKEVAITNMSAQEISKELGETILINTLGSKGMQAWKQGKYLYGIPAIQDKNVIDVCGCGDTVTAFIAIGLMRGEDIRNIIKKANLAASINIQHRGCYMLDWNEIEYIFNGEK